MAETEIKLSNKEVHAALSMYIANKYNVKVLSTTLHSEIRTEGRDKVPYLSHAVAEVVLNEK
jgi:hypothetical protein